MTTKQSQTLAGALLEAQKALPSVNKDAKFKGGSYSYAYTSSEAMIEACRTVLHGSGLLLRRAGWKFDGTPEGGVVTSSMIISYPATGESVTDEVSWVAVAAGGRPIDKQVAGALTASLGYYLRDLLLVPREDDNEMDKRDDEKYVPKKASPPSKPQATPKAPEAAKPAMTRQEATPVAKEAPKASGSAYVEVVGARPPKDARWKTEAYSIKKMSAPTATKNGGSRWGILLQDVEGNEAWSSCFDEEVAAECKKFMGTSIEVTLMTQENQYGQTLYGIRCPDVSSEESDEPEQGETPASVSEDEIPF
jgi:hypothetical protein